MKKKVLALIICFAIAVSAFCITSIAAGEAEEKIILDNNVFYVEFPEGFVFEKTMSENYYVYYEDYYSPTVEIQVEGNLMFPEGLTAAEDDYIKTVVKRLLGLTTTEYEITSVKREKINGTTVAVVDYVYDFMGPSEYRVFVFATKETVCLFETSYSTDDEIETEIVEDILSTVVINGTYFDGDKPENTHDFSKSENYYVAVNEYAEEYYKETEETGNTILKLFLLILLVPGLVIALIVFIVLWRKKAKLVKEYESYVGPIYMVKSAVNMQQNMAMPNNYVPYSPQMANPYQQPQNNMYNPQPQPYGQPQPQVQPQPVMPQPVQPQPQVQPQPERTQAILNGEVTDKNN